MARWDERYAAWEERKKELRKGRKDWRSSSVCFPNLGEGRLFGYTAGEGVCWLAVHQHSSGCPFLSVPPQPDQLLLGEGVWPSKRGARGWEFCFQVRVVLFVPGDLAGRWGVRLELDDSFVLPAPLSGVFRNGSLRIQGALSIVGDRGSRKTRYEREWVPGPDDRSGLEAADELGNCPIWVAPWTWGPEVVLTPHASPSLYRIALVLLQWRAMGDEIAWPRKS